MADSSSRPLQALHTPLPRVLYTRCSIPSMVSPPARAPCTKHLIVTSNVDRKKPLTPGGFLLSMFPDQEPVSPVSASTCFL